MNNLKSFVQGFFAGFGPGGMLGGARIPGAATKVFADPPEAKPEDQDPARNSQEDRGQA